MNELNHCQQIQILDCLLKGFFSSKFDSVLSLDKKTTELTAKDFYELILKPRIKELKKTGERMEMGLLRRKTLMQSTKLSPDENLEEKYKKLKNNKL